MQNVHVVSALQHLMNKIWTRYINITTDDTEILINYDDCQKHKVIFVAGFLTRKYDKQSDNFYDNEAQELTVSSEFINQLNRGRFTVPKLSTVFFVHNAVHTISQLNPQKAGCRNFVATELSFTDAPLANNVMACRTVANVLLKAHVLHHCDREQ